MKTPGWPAFRRLAELSREQLAVITPPFFALTTFLAGAILVISGATPARSGRLGWVNDILPVPIKTVSPEIWMEPIDELVLFDFKLTDKKPRRPSH